MMSFRPLALGEAEAAPTVMVSDLDAKIVN